MDQLELAQWNLLRVDSLPLLKSSQSLTSMENNGGTSFANQRVDATTVNDHIINREDYHNSFYPSSFDPSIRSTSHKVRAPRKSFTSLSDALKDIRLLSSRAASLRHKSFGSFKGSYHKDNRTISSTDRESQPLDSSRIVKWFRRDRRPNLPKSVETRNRASDSLAACRSVPNIEVEAVSLPCTPVGGAAARAAAAAQNEIYGLTRASNTRTDLRPVESKLTNDTESGICIDIHEPIDESKDRDGSIDFDHTSIRKDPIMSLPQEIVTQIMSYLDSTSLINASLVSHVWHNSSDTSYLWKHLFYAEAGFSCPPNEREMRIIKDDGSGMGNGKPDQEWKKMWKARKRLQQRWFDASATPTYLEGHRDSVYCVQFDEHKIITGSRDRTVRVWDAHSYRCIRVLGIPKPLAPDRNTVEGRHIMINKGQMVIGPSKRTQFEGPPPKAPPGMYHEQSVLCLQYDEELMVTGSSDKTCIVYEIMRWYKPIWRLRGHTGGVLDVCLNDRYIISCSKDTNIFVWNRSNGERERILRGHQGPVNAVAIRGDRLVSASGDGVVRLWNLTEGTTIKDFPSGSRGMACVEFSQDSQTIFAGGNDQIIYQFDVNTGRVIREFSAHGGLVRSLFLDSFNSRIISGSYDKTVKAFDLRTGDMICDISNWTPSWILSAKSNHRKLIATSQDGGIVVMDYGYKLPDIKLLRGYYSRLQTVDEWCHSS